MSNFLPITKIEGVISSREHYVQKRNCLRSFHLPKGEQIGNLHGINNAGSNSLLIA